MMHLQQAAEYKGRRTVPAVLIAVLLLGLAGSASADDKAADRKVVSQVEALLSGIEYVPTKADWERIGPKAAPVLRAIAADVKALATRRGRAVSALVYFPGVETRGSVTTLLRDPQAPAHVRGKAGLVLALTDGAASVKVLAPYADDKDNRLRERIIRALGEVPTAEARGVLERRLKVEPKRYLKTLIRRMIRQASRGKK